MWYISLFTWASSKDICVVHYNYSWAWASFNDLCVTRCTSSWTQASSSDLCVTHCNYCALSSFRALCMSHINLFWCATSNLGGGCASFLIFPIILWPELSPCSRSIPFFYPPRVIILRQVPHPSFYSFTTLPSPCCSVPYSLPTSSISRDNPLWHARYYNSTHRECAVWYKILIHGLYHHN